MQEVPLPLRKETHRLSTYRRGSRVCHRHVKDWYSLLSESSHKQKNWSAYLHIRGEHRAGTLARSSLQHDDGGAV